MLTRKVFYFFSDDGDPAFVRGIEFEDSGAKHFWTEELFGEGEDGGCFAGAGGPVE